MRLCRAYTHSFNRIASTPTPVSAGDLKVSSAATKRSIPPAQMGMSSSATAKPAELATTAQGTLVAYVASSLALEPK